MFLSPLQHPLVADVSSLGAVIPLLPTPWCSHSSSPTTAPRVKEIVEIVTFSPALTGRAVLSCPAKETVVQSRNVSTATNTSFIPEPGKRSWQAEEGAATSSSEGALQKPPPQTALAWESWLDLFPPVRILQLLVTASTISD